MAKSKYKYKSMDNFYDVESLDNVFTSVEFYPAKNAAIVSYIDDDNIINSIEAQQYIETIVRQKNNNFSGLIFWENLRANGSTDQSVFGLKSFAKRKGLTDNAKMINVDITDRDGDRYGYPSEYYPVKQTDPDYNENDHGISFGYNSTNYDLTMYAHLLSEIDTKYWWDNTTNPYDFTTAAPSAKELRDFNDELFDQAFKSNMASRLALSVDYQTGQKQQNYRSTPWSIRKAWLLTNRFIDVSRLNEKQRKVALKRLLGMLGLQILESDKLTNETHIENLEQMADLIAYNFSDVLNLQTLFEHEAYQQPFVLRNQLLVEYPETVYEKQNGAGPDNYKAYDGADKYKHIRKDRLTSDSTSAKFVEFVIAPYNKLTDQQTISFMYPDPAICEKLSAEKGYKIEPTDVLDDSKKWFEKNVAKPGTPAHDDFMQVYNFYAAIRGKNINISDKYNDDYGDDDMIETINNDYVKKLMAEFNTNLFYFDKDGNRTSCLVNFSVGGAHGAEIKLDLYLNDLKEYKQAIDELQAIKDMFNGDALAAINGDVYVETPKGESVKIRKFLKSGSTKSKADWKVIKEPMLFKKDAKSGKYAIDKKYTFVSVGQSNHEDFTSYYPLLLCQLRSFVNPARGDGADPYYGIFERRVEMKHKAHDKSLPEAERNMADLIQTLMKLLLNAASGAGDATFDNNIRVNNAIVSMRVIGQLFAWRIGQAQALAGARVPSTNTDGLYTMNIGWEENNNILFDIADSMYIGIEPEPLDRFVTKDSNNRLEVYKGEIVSAKGGALNSWNGPYPTQSLDHPAAIDNALAHYLAYIDDPADKPFNREYAKNMFANLVDKYGVKQNNPQEVLRFFQWILASSPGTNRYYYLEKTNQITGETTVENLQHYNRMFLTVPQGPVVVTPKLATRALVQEASVNRRIKNNEPVVQHDANAKQILAENGYIIENSGIKYDEARTQKVKGLPVTSQNNGNPGNQNVEIINTDILKMSHEEAWSIISRLDVNAYLDMLKATFLNSWSNDPKAKALADKLVEEGA